MAGAARPPADGEAVHVRQAHVEHDQVGAVALDRRQAVRSGRRHLDVVAGLRQLELEHARDRGVVLDDEHALPGGVHAPTIAARGPLSESLPNGPANAGEALGRR